MANKVINNNEILKKQSQQVFDTFSVLLKKHQVETTEVQQIQSNL